MRRAIASEAAGGFGARSACSSRASTNRSMVDFGQDLSSTVGSGWCLMGWKDQNFLPASMSMTSVFFETTPSRGSTAPRFESNVQSLESLDRRVFLRAAFRTSHASGRPAAGFRWVCRERRRAPIHLHVEGLHGWSTRSSPLTVLESAEWHS